MVRSPFDGLRASGVWREIMEGIPFMLSPEPVEGSKHDRVSFGILQLRGNAHPGLLAGNPG